MSVTLNKGLAIIIPAAGESRRLGQPKQLLKWKETTLLGHCIQKARSLDPEYIFVITGARREQIEAEATNHQASPVYVEEWQEGMGSSIAGGANKIIEDHPQIDKLLIVLPDQPLVTESHLRSLLEHSKNQALVATSYNSKPGVPAVISKAYIEDLTQLRGDTGARNIFAQNKNDLKLVEPDFALKDIDTVEDYRELLMMNWG